MIRMTTWFAAICAALCCMGTAASATDYPSRPIILTLAFAPGGPSDVLARILARRMEQILGQPLVIDNRPGAGGNIAAEMVAHAAPDGYTLLLATNGILATNATLYKKINYDPERDFAPVSLIATQANALVVHPSVPAQSLAELIALARAKPGTINFSSGGYGTASHLTGELFKAETGVDIVHVPYKGAGPALQDVIAGHVQMMFAAVAASIGQIQDATLRALAVTTRKRTTGLPNVATVAELGVAGFESASWHGLVAPAGTPNDVIEALYRAVATALADPAVRKSLTDLGIDVEGTTPQEFGAYIKAEIPKWSAVVKASGAKLD
jgi:tripartite-type tricarboxylate transporter receptor subunit TctC